MQNYMVFNAADGVYTYTFEYERKVSWDADILLELFLPSNGNAHLSFRVCRTTAQLAPSLPLTSLSMRIPSSKMSTTSFAPTNSCQWERWRERERGEREGGWGTRCCQSPYQVLVFLYLLAEAIWHYDFVENSKTCLSLIVSVGLILGKANKDLESSLHKQGLPMPAAPLQHTLHIWRFPYV